MPRQLVQYRAALDEGGNAKTMVAWIAETEAEKARYEIGLRQVAKALERMTEREIRSIVDKLVEIAQVLQPNFGISICVGCASGENDNPAVNNQPPRAQGAEVVFELGPTSHRDVVEFLVQMRMVRTSAPPGRRPRGLGSGRRS
jgi:hypothetical protein